MADPTNLSRHGPDEDLDAGGRRLPGRLVAAIVIAAAAALIVAALLVPHRDRAGTAISSAPSTTIAMTYSSSRAPTTPARPLIAYPAAPLRYAADQICEHAQSCVVGSGPPAAVLAARRALGPLRDLQVRTVGHRRGLIVGALAADGAQLLAVATVAGVRIDATQLQVVPPIGVQFQMNRRGPLTVVVSGTIDAVAQLGRAAVQRWLAGLAP